MPLETKISVIMLICAALFGIGLTIPALFILYDDLPGPVVACIGLFLIAVLIFVLTVLVGMII